MKETIERQRAQQRLQLAGEVIANTLESIFISDADGVIVDVNPAFCKITGKTHEQLVGREIYAIHPALHAEAEVWPQVRSHGHWVGETDYSDPSGKTVQEWLNLSTVRNSEGEITNYVGIFSNVSQLIERQQDLHYIANHDALTGLPNRMLLADRLGQEIKANQRNRDERLALLFIDLDGFKAVNDTFGHDAGDYMLKVAAERFTSCVRPADTVSRLGGDEFVIVLPHLKNSADCQPMLERLQQTLSQPVIFNGDELRVTLSIGVAIYPDHADGVEALMQRADQAMYRAKQAGKNRYHLYDES